mgnify:CR=1 FL=1
MLAVQSSRPLVPFANPGYGYGRAILGSMGGNLGGGLLGSLVASVVAPPPGPAPSGVQGEVGVDEATQAQAERADKAWAYLTAAFATLGAAAGAAAAARPQDRRPAAIGAALGTAAGRGVRVWHAHQSAANIGDPVMLPVGTALVTGPLGTAAGIAAARHRRYGQAVASLG